MFSKKIPDDIVKLWILSLSEIILHDFDIEKDVKVTRSQFFLYQTQIYSIDCYSQFPLIWERERSRAISCWYDLVSLGLGPTWTWETKAGIVIRGSHRIQYFSVGSGKRLFISIKCSQVENTEIIFEPKIFVETSWLWYSVYALTKPRYCSLVHWHQVRMSN
jgi:hypothetical protein